MQKIWVFDVKASHVQIQSPRPTQHLQNPRICIMRVITEDNTEKAELRNRRWVFRVWMVIWFRMMGSPSRFNHAAQFFLRSPSMWPFLEAGGGTPYGCSETLMIISFKTIRPRRWGEKWRGLRDWMILRGKNGIDDGCNNTSFVAPTLGSMNFMPTNPLSLFTNLSPTEPADFFTCQAKDPDMHLPLLPLHKISAGGYIPTGNHLYQLIVTPDVSW